MSVITLLLLYAIIGVFFNGTRATALLISAIFFLGGMTSWVLLILLGWGSGYWLRQRYVKGGR